MEGFQTPSGKVEIASSLLKCAESYVAAKNDRAAGSIYDRILATPALPASLRKAGMIGRINTSGDRAGAVVLELLKSNDPSMQEVAIGKIKDVGLALPPALSRQLTEASVAVLNQQKREGSKLVELSPHEAARRALEFMIEHKYV
jgi:hypothetical protein